MLDNFFSIFDHMVYVYYFDFSKLSSIFEIIEFAHLDENEEDRSGQISTDHFYTLQAIQVFGFEAITKFNYFNAIDCLILSTNSK